MPKWVSPLKETTLLMSVSTSTSASMSPKKMDKTNWMRKMLVVTRAMIRKMVLFTVLNRLVNHWSIIFQIYRFVWIKQRKRT